jgi:hypothetical protein
MKLKLITWFLCLLCVSYAQASIFGDITVVSHDGTDISPYQYPLFRESDILFIKNITLYNNGNETLYNISIRISGIPPSKNKFMFCNPLGYHLSELRPNKTYSFSTDNPNLKQMGVLSCGFTLTETGTYFIESNVLFRLDYGYNSGYTVIVNGGSNNLMVKSYTEMIALEETKKSSDFAFWALLGTWIAVIISIWAIIGTKNDNKQLLMKLEEAAANIQKSTNEATTWELNVQLKKDKVRATNKLRAFIDECEYNIALVKHLLGNKEVYQEGSIYERRFSTFCLENLLTDTTYTPPDQISKLFSLREPLITGNNFFESLRYQKKINRKKIWDEIYRLITAKKLESINEIKNRFEEFIQIKEKTIDTLPKLLDSGNCKHANIRNIEGLASPDSKYEKASFFMSQANTLLLIGSIFVLALVSAVAIPSCFDTTSCDQAGQVVKLILIGASPFGIAMLFLGTVGFFYASGFIENLKNELQTVIDLFKDWFAIFLVFCLAVLTLILYYTYEENILVLFGFAATGVIVILSGWYARMMHQSKT